MRSRPVSGIRNRQPMFLLLADRSYLSRSLSRGDFGSSEEQREPIAFSGIAARYDLGVFENLAWLCDGRVADEQARGNGMGSKKKGRVDCEGDA